MTHDADPGYVREPFASLVASYPGEDVYPPADFRVEWGPVVHRGLLDGTARVLVIGQDPGQHENIARRILVGEAGQRVQGFLAKLGIATSYVRVNTFVYSVYGQWGGTRHRDDPAIAAYCNAWLDALLVETEVSAVLALGTLADHAFATWRATPSGSAADVVYRHVTHPTYPESASAAGQITYAEALASMVAGWNDALAELRPAVGEAEVEPASPSYGTSLDPGRDLAPIPERDLPPGVPAWMRSLDPWAERAGEDTEDKRATIVVRVPQLQRPWRI